MKPFRVLENLKIDEKSKDCVIKIRDLYNYLQTVRKTAFGRNNISLGALASWCFDHSYAFQRSEYMIDPGRQCFLMMGSRVAAFLAVTGTRTDLFDCRSFIPKTHNCFLLRSLPRWCLTLANIDSSISTICPCPPRRTESMSTCLRQHLLKKKK